LKRQGTSKNQKPFEQDYQLSSHENDLVFDCFVGGGTTAAVAEKLKRR